MMKILPVRTKKEKAAFLETARWLYRNDDTWVCPLNREINAIFDPGQNIFFRHGEAQRWIMLDPVGNPAGRVAAFIDRNSASLHDQPTGGMGFFECINDRKAAFLLFDKARDWLAGRGMEAMDGPINFGETDKYWGLLVDDFTPLTPEYISKTVKKARAIMEEEFIWLAYHKGNPSRFT